MFINRTEDTVMIKDRLKDREKQILLETLTPEFANSLERAGRLWKLPKDTTYKGKVFKSKSLSSIETTVFDLEFETISTRLKLLVRLAYTVSLVVIWVEVMDYCYHYLNNSYMFSDNRNIIIGMLLLPIAWLGGRMTDSLLIQPAINQLQTRCIKLAMSYKETPKD